MPSQDTKLKILITTDLFTTDTNGVVTSVKNLFDELTANGHDVKILTISNNLHSHKEGAVYYIRSIPLKAVYPNLRMPVSYRHKLIQEIIDWKPDVVHSQCEFFSFQFAARISRITGAPIVHTYHTLYEQYLTSYVIPSKRLGDYLAKVLSRHRLKQVKSLVAPTQKVENTLQSYGMRAPISVVPSGISLEQHHKRLTPQQRLERREAVGILLLFGVFLALLFFSLFNLTEPSTLQLYALLNLVLFPFGTPLLLHLFPTRTGGQFRPRRVLLSLLITGLLFFLSTAFLYPEFYWDLTNPEMIRYDFNDTSIDDTLILLLADWLVALSSNLLCYAAHLWHRGFCAQNP